MGWSVEDSIDNWLSRDDWRGLQSALTRLRPHVPSEEDRITVTDYEVISVLQEAGALDAAELYRALTKRFRLVKL